MRFLAAITLAHLVLTGCQTATQSLDAGLEAYQQKDYATALKHFRPLAKQGHTLAQLWLGDMYYFGEGVTYDLKEAVRWYRLSAEQGDPGAQTSLGWMYYKGRGVTQDYKEAVRLYRKAAKQGQAEA